MMTTDEVTADESYPSTYEGVLAVMDRPVVAIDEGTFFIYVNAAFEEAYGWTERDLLGQSVTNIMPEHMRNIHMIGFSRFIATEQPHILGQVVELPILHKDGSEGAMKLYITAAKQQNAWHFAAVVTPKQDG